MKQNGIRTNGWLSHRFGQSSTGVLRRFRRKQRAWRPVVGRFGDTANGEPVVPDTSGGITNPEQRLLCATVYLTICYGRNIKEQLAFSRTPRPIEELRRQVPQKAMAKPYDRHLPLRCGFGCEVALQLAQIPLELPNYGFQPLPNR